MDKLTIEVKAPEIAEAVKTLAESLSRFAEVYRAAQQVQPVQQPIQPVQQQAQPGSATGATTATTAVHLAQPGHECTLRPTASSTASRTASRTATPGTNHSTHIHHGTTSGGGNTANGCRTKGSCPWAFGRFWSRGFNTATTRAVRCVCNSSAGQGCKDMSEHALLSASGASRWINCPLPQGWKNPCRKAKASTPKRVAWRMKYAS